MSWLLLFRPVCSKKENAIISVENALVTYKDIVLQQDLVIRTDNGSQYTSKAFRKFILLLGFKLEHIYYNTPEQNGHIESFHRTIKKEYIWSNDFQNYEEAESAIKDAFVDYNQNRIYSSVEYLTPYEFISKWKMQQEEEEKKKVINIGNENSIHKIMGKVFPKIWIHSTLYPIVWKYKAYATVMVSYCLWNLISESIRGSLQTTT